MLAAAAAGKGGGPNPNPNPNWLDRLRSNKGFPIGDELGLDHFLAHHKNLHNPSPPSTSAPANPHSDPNSPDGSSYVLITGILSDLFNIAAPSKCSAKKFPRKQSNPKICPTLPSHTKQQHNILSSNSDNTSMPKPKPKPKPKPTAEEQEVEDDDKPGDKELVGYSKSEVTVIDTSCDLWKSDKLIFRRKNVWKVKDKKGKLRSYGRKNRNLHSPHLPDATASANYKTKLWGSQERFHFTAQQLRGNESLKPSNKGYTPQYCSGPEISANAPDSGNDKKENAYTVSPEIGSYDSEKSGKFSCTPKDLV